MRPRSSLSSKSCARRADLDMENVEYYHYNGLSFRPGRSRRLLASQGDRLPPPPTSQPCRDVKSGEAIRCTNPHTLTMVLAGMACMTFLVCVALALLCWSVVKQRRRQQQAANSQPPQTTPSSPQISASACVDSAEYDDAVLVQLPGDEEPQFFALPKPFLADGVKDLDRSNVVDSEVDEKFAKETESEPPDDRPRD